MTMIAITNTTAIIIKIIINVILNEMRKKLLTLANVSETLKRDKDFVLEAIKIDPQSLQYASERRHGIHFESFKNKRWFNVTIRI